MRRYKKLLVVMVVWLVLGITNAFGSNVILEFNQDGVLPSSQGLTYYAAGIPNATNPPESSLFSVSGGLLHMNTIGQGTSAWYQLSNAYDPTQDFVLEFRMKVLQGAPFSFGIDFEVADANYDYEFGFGSAGIALPLGVNFSFSTMDDFHTYKIVAPASIALNKTYQLFIDDVLRHTGTISPAGDGIQRFLFGDGTFSADGKADIDFIRFCQPACPLTADVDINPDKINKKAKGRYVHAVIQFPDDIADPSQIDISTITLQAIAPISSSLIYVAPGSPAGIGDANGDGTADLTVHFDRTSVQTWFSGATLATFRLSGKLFDGTSFAGEDTVEILDVVEHSNESNASSVM